MSTLKRKWSGTPRFPIPQYATSIEKQHEPTVYRLIFSLHCYDDDYDHKSFLLEIPSKVLDPFRNSDYIADVHGCRKLPTYPQFLASTNWFVYGKPVVIGSTMYALALKDLSFDTHMEMVLLTLDLDSQVKEWEILQHTPPFEIQTTNSTVLAPLHGRLYVLGAYPSFGAIFDPSTGKWSKLNGSNGVKLNSVNIAFFASLGESVAKILVHEYEDPWKTLNSSICLYNVDSNEWEIYPGESLMDPYMPHYDIVDTPVVALEDVKNPTLYFVNNRGIFYGFEYKTRKLYKGFVLGFDEAGLRGALGCGGHACTAFLHFGGDLFCVCFSTYEVFKPSAHGCRTWLHFVFIRVNKVDDHSTTTLNAKIVGCLEDIIDGDINFHGYFFV